MKHTLKLITYFDVWGGMENGWTVNDQCTAQTGIELPNLDDQTILDWLIDNDYIKKGTTTDDIEFSQDSDTYIDMVQSFDAYPLYALVRED